MTNSSEGKFSHTTESEPAHTKFGQAARQIEPERDLEYYIETLRRLDEQRKDSGKRRDYGIDVIKHWLRRGPTKTKEEAFSIKTVSRYARAIEYLYQDSARRPDGLDKLLHELFKELQDFINGSSTVVSSVLWTIRIHRLPVVFATELFQAFLSVPGRSYSKTALLCYYYIMRELYTADAPLWSIGGARAKIASGAKESPYVTYQCVQSIQRFIEYQQHTSRYIACLSDYYVQTQRLSSNKAMPSDWSEQEKIRINYSCFITLQQYGKTSVLTLNPPSAPGEMQKYFTETLAQQKTTARDVAAAFADAVKEINEFWDWEVREHEKNETNRQMERERAGHTRAKLAIELGRGLADEVSNLFNGGAPGVLGPLEKLKAVQKNLEKAAQETLKAIQPATTYFEVVLDHELAAATNPDHSWDPAQLALTASSLVSGPDKRWRQDWRIPEAVSVLSNSVSDRGVLPLGQPFHVEDDDLHFADPAMIIMAYAELIRRTPTVKVDPGLVKKMLLFFDDTLARDLGFDEERAKANAATDVTREGWCGLYPPKKRFNSRATLRAVNALAAINRMLDEKINQLVLAHFTVKSPKWDLEHNLDALFYPDYGLVSSAPALRNTIKRPSCVEESKWPKDLGRTESVAITLQRMRAHVKRVSLEPKEDICCSVAFHGPAGTGKTTLVEALAKSCDVPLIEVTPSDIIVRGEEAIERRARAVFEALSLLTRVVILFDEFDPVLWKRDPAASSPRSVFTFLTPGMLPKLKDLRRCAKKRSCAFVLSTNLIGSLDTAAIREGRFDKKVGIYPPDPLSRAGRLLNQVDAYLGDDDVTEEGLAAPADLHQKVLDFVKSTGGGAMEALGKWFSAPEAKEAKKFKNNKTDGELNPFAYIFGGTSAATPKNALREDYLKRHPNGRGEIALLEFVQWWWIQQCDAQINNQKEWKDIRWDASISADALNDLTSRLREWKTSELNS